MHNNYQTSEPCFGFVDIGPASEKVDGLRAIGFAAVNRKGTHVVDFIPARVHLESQLADPGSA